MRPAMRFLAWGLADMAMMDDLTPAGEQWVMKQCAAVRKYAAEAGDEPPPMVSSEWVEGFSKRVWKRMEQEEAAREREKSMRGEFAAAEEEPEEKAPSPYSGEKYVRGFRERFLKPLGTNPLWKDLFPGGDGGEARRVLFASRARHLRFLSGWPPHGACGIPVTSSLGGL